MLKRVLLVETVRELWRQGWAANLEELAELLEWPVDLVLNVALLCPELILAGDTDRPDKCYVGINEEREDYKII